MKEAVLKIVHDAWDENIWDTSEHGGNIEGIKDFFAAIETQLEVLGDSFFEAFKNSLPAEVRKELEHEIGSLEIALKLAMDKHEKS